VALSIMAVSRIHVWGVLLYLRRSVHDWVGTRFMRAAGVPGLLFLMQR
jgi:hypothetical protein